MASSLTPAGLSVALMLLLCGVPHEVSTQSPISVLVMNSITSAPNQTYSAHAAYGGVLFGALRRLQDSNANFTFTYEENKDYGLFLLSVNGLAEDSETQTYWQLLGTTNGSTTPLNVGIGCYIPSEGEQVILKFTSY
ncbi:cobalamin binding intrinsic factor-like [Genypterus blacodes]|uniref:cobalamin binding intrinsic factor-like n=1 Tax=Genypterus blacodes TaxID=154954 RepID=UPI003F771B04